MISTLGKKLFVFIAAILVLVLAATLFVLERGQSRQLEDYLRAQSVSYARLATPEILKFFRGTFPPPERLPQQELREILAFNPDLVMFFLYSGSGRLLYASPRFIAVPDLGEEALSTPGLEDRVRAAAMSLDNLTPPQGPPLLDLVNPALGPTGEHVLSVRFLISYGGIRHLQAATRSNFLSSAAIAVVVSLLLAALVARRITRPLKNLTSGARAIARGDLDFHLPPASQDEIGTLARAFNDMAVSLAQKHHELVNKNAALEDANQELRQVQESLIRAEKLAAIGQLAAGVSHEIDNPVGIILGYAELLLEEFPADDPRREDVETIIRECKRCRRITGGLLGLARSEPTRRERVVLGELVDETCRSLWVQKLFRDIRLRVVRPPAPVAITGDGDKLRQVLINLLLNAAQALGGAGEIRIELAREGGRCRLTVADSGPGIAPADREKIFEPFFTTKERGLGTGLGLAVCRKLVEEHGGGIEAETAAGGGARFRVVLPLAAEEKNFDITRDNSLG